MNRFYAITMYQECLVINAESYEAAKQFVDEVIKEFYPQYKVNFIASDYTVRLNEVEKEFWCYY